MKLEALKTYRDTVLERVVNVGETIDAEKERAEMLIKIGYAQEPGKDKSWEKKETK